MDMLTKPFALDALGAKVRAMIEQKEKLPWSRKQSLRIATVGAAVGRVEGEAKRGGAASDPFAK
jgi:hypothetical protein